MQRRKDGEMTNEEKEREVKKKRWGLLSHSGVSQGNWMDVGGGGLLFQLGESNHLISSNCNESILSGEERSKWE